MNTRHLHEIFQKYIDNFEYINNSENDENYKWEIAEAFQSFDLYAKDFSKELSRLCKISANLIDSGYGLPFNGLVEYAKYDQETVRKMFIDLYEDDNGDLSAKQRKINAFIESSEILRKKYAPDSHLYVNNQRSAMQFLFLKDPDHNYMYKAVQAKSFADCVEFYEDWGPMSDFRIEVFYRMCDLLVEEIKKYPELVATHQSRYEKSKKPLHEDNELHILAFDIIYSSQVYNFYSGMNITSINAQARKLHEERVAKAKHYHEVLTKAQEENDKLRSANEYLKETFSVGTKICHRFFKEGIITETNDQQWITVDFNGSEKKLNLATLIVSGSILIDDESVKAKTDEYKAVLKNSLIIPQALVRAEKDFSEYEEYYI